MQDNFYPFFNLDIPKMGYMIAYEAQKNPGFFERQIIKEQRKAGYDEKQSLITHCEISIGGPYTVGAVFPRVSVMEITKDFSGRSIVIARLRCADLRTHTKVAVWAATRCNLPYGILSTLYFKMENIIGQQNLLATINRPFCSYLCAWAYEREIPGIFDCKPATRLPAFVYDPQFEIVWKGIIP